MDEQQSLGFPKPIRKISEPKLYKRGPQYKTLSFEERKQKREEYFKKKKEKKALKKLKNIQIYVNHAPRLKKLAWAIFSVFTRMRDSILTTGGLKECICITCSSKRPTFGVACIQAGHFIPGRGNEVLFDEKQVNGQCKICNYDKKGNWAEYYKVMIARHGKEIVEQMIFEARGIRKYTADDYRRIIKAYKFLIDSMLKEKGTELEYLEVEKILKNHGYYRIIQETQI